MSRLHATVKRLGLLLLLVGATRVHAQWGPDVKLSTNEVSAFLNENMAHCIVASGGALHVVWCDLNKNGQAIYYKRSLDHGVTWGPDTRVSGTPSSNQWPSLAVSGSTVHLVFLRDSGTDEAASYYKQSPDGGATWGSDVLLGTTKWWPSVAAVGSTVYVALNTLVTTNNSEVSFRRSLDNGTNWEAQLPISNADGRSEDPALAADGSYVYLVWNDNRDGTMEVYFRRSSDWGVTWGPETALTHTPANTYMPTIYPVGSTVDVAYCDRHTGALNVFHLRSTDFGSTWEASQALTHTNVNQLYPALASDGLNLHVAWFSTDIAYRRSGNGGASWTPAVTLVSAPGQSMLMPHIAVDGDRVHMIWKDSRTGHGAVYYKCNPTGNKSAAPVIVGLASNGPAGPLALCWTGVTGMNYAIEYSTNLLNGFSGVLRTNMPADLPVNTSAVDVLGDSAFYRVRLE